MKKIVIYYSFEGNTRLIAEHIAEAIEADLLELQPKKEIQSKGFMKYIWGGKAALMKATPELLPLDKNPEHYDLVFIGTPVWAGTYPPSLHTFFTTFSFSDKKIALFCCHGGGKGKVFDKMKKSLKNNQIIGEIDFQDPLKHNTDVNLENARKWADSQLEAF